MRNKKKEKDSLKFYLEDQACKMCHNIFLQSKVQK